MYLHCRSTFELTDGRTLECEWYAEEWPATFHDPGDREDGEPVYTLDGKPVDVDALPRGLEDIARRMYDDPDKFGYEVKTYSRRFDADYEPPEPDYDYD